MKKLLPNVAFFALSLTAVTLPVIGADLSEIFKQSQAHDPQLSAAKHTLNASAEGKKQAFAAFLPQVNGSLGKNLNKFKTDNSIAGAFPSARNRTDSWNISLSQTIYDHANYQNYNISKLQVLKSEADYETTYQDFILRVAQSYFDSLAAKDNLIFSKAEEKAIQRQLDQAEQRFEVGLAAITDVHEARARFDSARASVILAQNQQEDANEALFEISQRYYQDLAPAPDDLDFSQLKLSTMDVYQDQGIKINPALISSQLDKDIAEKQIKLNKAGHYPTFSMSASRGYSFNPGNIVTQFNPDSGELFQVPTGDNTTDSTSLNLNLSIPIYSGGRTSSQVRQSVHNHKSAMDRYEQTRRNTVRSIRNAYHGTIATQSSVQARELAMVSAQSGLEATEAGYEVGTRTIVDVLNAQRSLYQAQRDFSKAKYDYFIQYLTLKRSAGLLNENDITTINNILK